MISTANFFVLELKFFFCRHEIKKCAFACYPAVVVKDAEIFCPEGCIRLQGVVNFGEKGSVFAGVNAEAFHAEGRDLPGIDYLLQFSFKDMRRDGVERESYWGIFNF